MWISPAVAVDICTVTATWTAPTHYAKDGDCLDQSMPMDPTEAVEYTVMWRVKGSADWTQIDTTNPTVTLQGLPFATTIEVMVGTHAPGSPVLCYSAVSEITTIAKPAPGACSQIQLTTGYSSN